MQPEINGTKQFPPFFYPKIGDSSTWTKVPKKGKQNPWFVLEKVHGSCFLLATDGETIRAAKRTAWLEQNDGYHDVSGLMEQYSESLKRVHKLLGKGQVTYVFGEIFGTAVQDEIFYGPEFSFVCFDIACDGVFVDYVQVLSVCAEAKLPCLQPLFKGTFSKCASFNVDFVSTIPKLFGECDAVSKAEGVVVKCSVEIEVELSKGVLARGVCKIKSAKFSEVISKAAVTRGRELTALQNYVTRNRVVNVVSKMGKIRDRAAIVEKVAELVLEDVTEEARANDGLLLAYLEKSDIEARKTLRPMCKSVAMEWSKEKK